MLLVATGVFGIFGLASIAGGVLGWRKAGSRASLVAGGGSGILLLSAAGALAAGATDSGLLLGGGTSLLLAGRFVPAFLKKRKWMPQGLMAVLSAIATLVTVVTYCTT